MKEVLYTIAGKRLPVLMNIGARALTSQDPVSTQATSRLRERSNFCVFPAN